MTAKSVLFKGHTWDILVRHYETEIGPIALVLVPHAPLVYDPSDYVVATTNLDEKPRDGYVFVKNWSENWGMLPALVAAGVVGPSTRLVPAGYTFADECQLLITAADSAPDPF